VKLRRFFKGGEEFFRSRNGPVLKQAPQEGGKKRRNPVAGTPLNEPGFQKAGEHQMRGCRKGKAKKKSQVFIPPNVSAPG